MKLWRSLRRGKGRAETGLFLAEGPNLLAELVESAVLVRQVLCAPYATDDAKVARLLLRCEAAGIPCERLRETEFGRLADVVSPQGVLAVAEIPARGWDDLRKPRVLLLDEVQDPGNLGTLVRTAEALGLGGVVALDGTADPWNPKAVRAAAGSSLRLPVFRSSRAEAVARLNERSIRLWCADPAGEPFRRGAVAPRRLALALGNEARGVSESLVRASERCVSVPMAGRVESLNVAIAGAVLLDRMFETDVGTREAKGR
ncbi:MAG: TrmH family RNA methyltransferase [Gemmatimonadota bacterium]